MMMMLLPPARGWTLRYPSLDPIAFELLFRGIAVVWENTDTVTFYDTVDAELATETSTTTAEYITVTDDIDADIIVTSTTTRTLLPNELTTEGSNEGGGTSSSEKSVLLVNVIE